MQQRERYLSRHREHGACIVYWMSRDQRVNDNWALLFAQQQAIQRRLPLIVVFYLCSFSVGTSSWHLTFMIEGLKEVEKKLSLYRIPFFLVQGSFDQDFLVFLKKCDPALIVTDFDPLHLKRERNTYLSQNLSRSLIEVDTHNIVPCWLASSHQEFAARTFRPKIQRLISTFLVDIPPLQEHPKPWKGFKPSFSWPVIETLPPGSPIPGESAAWEAFLHFLEKGIHRYAKERNNPLAGVTSRLSPYFHFGQLSPQRVAYEITQLPSIHESNRQAFLEELIVRRELSDNFVYYQKNYYNWNGIPSWAQKTLDQHRHDPRQYLYDREDLECGRTHDFLWNACQKHVRVTGYLHGYLRMYWAKKILEWAPSPEIAIDWAIYLNDAYCLDGRDPNGYVGVLWSIGGLHDRPFSDRPIIGRIRPMTLSGCKRKFSVETYIAHVEKLSSQDFSG